MFLKDIICKIIRSLCLTPVGFSRVLSVDVQRCVISQSISLNPEMGEA